MLKQCKIALLASMGLLGIATAQSVNNNQLKFFAHQAVLQIPHTQQLARFIVVFKQPTARAVAEAKVAQFAAATGLPITTSRQIGPSIYTYSLDNKKLLAMSPVESWQQVFSQANTQIESDNTVKSSELDRIFHIPTPPRSQIAVQPPNETQQLQWDMFFDSGSDVGGVDLTCSGITSCEDQSAWRMTEGQGINVAVLDTGETNNNNLDDNMLPGANFHAWPYNNDPTDGDGPDPSYHGEHVAGTIAAYGPSVYGVAPQARIVPIKVCGFIDGFGYGCFDDAILAGIEWSVGNSVQGVTNNENTAKVLNLSLGGSGACTSAEETAFNDARSKGATVVVAAGNSNADAANFSPANCPQVIDVAATTRTASRSYYSNYGETVSIAAPGGETNSVLGNGILSTLNNNSFTFYQGTSMAAPHVAGLAALMYAVGDYPTSSLAGDEVETVMKENATPFATTVNPDVSCVGDKPCGAGIINVGATIDAVAAGITFDEEVNPPTSDLGLSAMIAPGVYCPRVSNAQTKIATTRQFNQTSLNAGFTLQWQVQSRSCYPVANYDQHAFSVTNGVATLRYSPDPTNVDEPATVYTATLPSNYTCVPIDDNSKLGCTENTSQQGGHV